MFLKVLCILTFIGTGLGILGSLYNIFTFDMALESLENSKRIFRRVNMGSIDSQIVALKKWGMTSYLATLAGNLLCLLGALMMWRLKKNGFYVYVAGQVLPLIGSALFVSSIDTSEGTMSSMVYVSFVFALIIAIAFGTMYTLNLKHLK